MVIECQVGYYRLQFDEPNMYAIRNQKQNDTVYYTVDFVVVEVFSNVQQ